MKVVLTSCGLETETIKNTFINLFEKDPDKMTALFIPTAAIYPDAIGVLPKCMNDLLKCGIPAENIVVFDLHRNMDFDELSKYDIVYLCGGSPSYLLERINDSGFFAALKKHVDNDGIILGVSAGSMVFASNMENNLGLINTNLYVHCGAGEPEGPLSYPFEKDVALTNNQALIIRSFDNIRVIGS